MANESTFPKFQDYDVLKQVGKGAFSIVYKVRSKDTKQVYALKTIQMSKMDEKTLMNALNEVRILCSINHPNIVGYKEAFVKDNNMCVVMEFVGGGDLLDKIEKAKRDKTHLPENLIWEYSVQILNGLKVLHSLKIIHRDIKSANMFLSDDHQTVKLGDMNLAKVAKEDFASTQIGTPFYLAPEIWLNKRYDYRCDIFSLGCVMYEMAALEVPFNVISVFELLNKITVDTPERIPKQYTEELNDVIGKFMEKDPEQRPTTVQALNVVETCCAFDNKYRDEDCDEASDINILMKTITIPKNLKMLNNLFPKKRQDNDGNSIIEANYIDFDFDNDEDALSADITKSLDSMCYNRMRSSAMKQTEDNELNISRALKEMCLNNKLPNRTSKKFTLNSIKSFADGGENSLKISIKNIDNDVKGRSRVGCVSMMGSYTGSDMFYNPFKK